MSAPPSSSQQAPAQRLLRWMLNLAIVGGLSLAAWPLAQTVYARYNQNQLEQEWRAQNTQIKPKAASNKAVTKVAKVEATGVTASSDAPTMVGAQPNASRGKTKTKWPLTKLSIPDIDLETYAVQGWDEASLRRGPGHDPNSAMPGQGNCVLAGHRNIYGSYFYKVDQILPGSPIVLESREGKFTYTTGQVITTTDTDYSIMAQPKPGEPPILTLITCTIPHTSNRIIVQAVLSRVE